MSRENNYSPQIDSLRALAIMVVMLHHYLITPFFLSGFGVVMFFLLSGYFGTQTLLRLRTKMEAQSTTPWQAFATFYNRRYSRIVPLHYLVLGLTSIAGVACSRKTLLWNASFLSNYFILRADEWPDRFSQLWSLAALEQFYLFWPAAILFLPRRSLVWVSFGGILLALGWRVYCNVALLPPIAWTVMPFAGLDQLCVGSLLALSLGEKQADLLLISHRQLLRAGKVGILVFAVLMAAREMGMEAPYSGIYLPLVASVAFVWVADGARLGFGGRVGQFFSSPLLCHCGRISFGAFLIHNFTELLLPKWLQTSRFIGSNYAALLLIPVTFCLADLAWRFFENPLRKFQGSTRAVASDPERNYGSLLLDAFFVTPFLDLKRKWVKTQSRS